MPTSTPPGRWLSGTLPRLLLVALLPRCALFLLSRFSNLCHHASIPTPNVFLAANVFFLSQALDTAQADTLLGDQEASAQVVVSHAEAGFQSEASPKPAFVTTQLVEKVTGFFVCLAVLCVFLYKQ